VLLSVADVDERDERGEGDVRSTGRSTGGATSTMRGVAGALPHGSSLASSPVVTAASPDPAIFVLVPMGLLEELDIIELLRFS
jgi:hypothetical protein